jgi:hypothetical protein
MRSADHVPAAGIANFPRLFNASVDGAVGNVEGYQVIHLPKSEGSEQI